MCMIDDAEHFSVFDSAKRKAVKHHECSECGRQITKGETYEAARGLSEGIWQRFATCAHCIAARQWLVVVCSGYIFEGVLEELRQHWEEEPQYRSIWLGRAIKGMERKWRGHRGLMRVLPPPPAVVQHA